MLLILDILVQIWIRGSLPLTSDSDPDPEPAIFVLDLQDANKKLFLDILEVHLHHFSKIESHLEVRKQ